VHAKDLVRRRHDPVDERRFFEVGDAVQAGSHPVPALEHVAGDLRLHSVDIIHQVRRAEDQRKKGAASDDQDDRIYIKTA